MDKIKQTIVKLGNLLFTYRNAILGTLTTLFWVSLIIHCLNGKETGTITFFLLGAIFEGFVLERKYKFEKAKRIALEKQMETFIKIPTNFEILQKIKEDENNRL